MGLRVFVCLSLLGFSTLGFGWMPEFKKCGDEECARMMSRVQAERDFTAPNCRFLSFKRGDIITVYYKLTGEKRDLWGGSIDKAFGLFPKQATRVEQQFIDEKSEIQVPTQEYDFYCTDENGQQIESSTELDDLDDPIQTPGSADALKAEDKRTENEEKQTRQNSDQDVSHPNRPESAETGGSSWISSAVSGWFDRSEKSNGETSQSREIATDAPEEDQAGTLGWISGELTNAFGFRRSAQDESKKPSSSQDPRRLEAEETSNLGVNETSGEDPASAEISTESENFLETQTQMDSQDLETKLTPQTSDAFRGNPESLVEDDPDIPDQTELGQDISGTFEEMEQAEGEDQDPDVVRVDEEENHVKKEEHKSARLEDEKIANRYSKQTSKEEEDNEGMEQENQEQALNTEEDEHSMFSVGGITSALRSIGFPFQERVEKKEEGIVGKEEYSGQQDVEDEDGSDAEELESEPTVLEESDESDDLMVIEDVSVSGANEDEDEDEQTPIQNSTAPSLPRTIAVEDLEIREENIKSDELGVKEPEIDEEIGIEDGAEPQIVNDEDPSDDEQQFPSDSITETLTEPNKTSSSEDRARGEDITELRSSEEACSRGDNVSISADTLSDDVIQAKTQSIDNTVRSELDEHEDFETVNHQESSCSDHESQSSEQRSDDVDPSVDSKVEMDTVGESVNADVHPEGEPADANEAVAGEDKEKERRRNEMSEDIVVNMGSEMSENAETNSSGHSEAPHVPTGDSEVKSEMLSELNSVDHDTNSSISHAKSLEGEETSNLGVNEISEDPSSAEISTESENFLGTQTQMDLQDLETKLTPQTSDAFRDNPEPLIEDVPDIPDQTSTEYSTSENDQPINISTFSQHNHEAEAVEDEDDPTIVEAKKHDEENHTTVIQIQSEMVLPGDAVKQPEEPSGNSETTEKVFTHSQLEPKKVEEKCRDYPNLESHLTEEDCEVLTRLFGDHKLSWLDSQMAKSSNLITVEDNKTLSDFEEELETHTRLGSSSQHHDGFPEMDDAGEGSALRKLLLLLSTVREMCSPVSVDESPETRGDDGAQDQDTDTSFFSQEDDGDNETLMDEDVQTAGGETGKQSDWTWSEDKRTSSRQHDQDSEERDESEQSRDEKDAGLYSQLASFLYVVLSGVVTVLKKSERKTYVLYVWKAILSSEPSPTVSYIALAATK